MKQDVSRPRFSFCYTENNKLMKKQIELAQKKIEYSLHVSKRASYFAAAYGLSYKKISIKRQKTRWGSCSRAGNLSFNYWITFLPSRLLDYVVVHEICHLKEFNHSRKFWTLLAETFPDYAVLKKQLRTYRLR